jgi:hypothetical protein
MRAVPRRRRVTRACSVVHRGSVRAHPGGGPVELTARDLHKYRRPAVGVRAGAGAQARATAVGKLAVGGEFRAERLPATVAALEVHISRAENGGARG